MDLLSPVLFWFTLIFSLSVAGRALAKWCGQPGVLGELIMGAFFGNLLSLAHSPMAVVLRDSTLIERTISPEYLKIAYTLDVFSRYGVIFMLFLVGVESGVRELKRAGAAACRVAVVGVLAPMILGGGIAYVLLPTLSYPMALFIGATLCATSVGVTARVLRELDRLHTREAHTILGSAVLDDILGLLVLAIVTRLVMDGRLDWVQLGFIVCESIAFLVAVFACGPWVIRHLMFLLYRFDEREATLITTVIVVMGCAWVATRIHLAAIVGAFAAGLMMHDGHALGAKTIRELVTPIEALLAPLFFMLIGMQVKLESFLDLKVLWMTGGLLLAAILGKLLSGAVASRRDDRVLIGLGMIPRGEVGVIFASIGKQLGVLSDPLFSAIMLMIMVTTLITPPLMKWRLHDTRSS